MTGDWVMIGIGLLLVILVVADIGRASMSAGMVAIFLLAAAILIPLGWINLHAHH